MPKSRTLRFNRRCSGARGLQGRRLVRMSETRTRLVTAVIQDQADATVLLPEREIVHSVYGVGYKLEL